MVFDQFFHDGFRRVADLVTGMGMPLVDAEREIFGRDHAFVGRQLARRWNFPSAVTEAIGCHHDPAVRGSIRAGRHRPPLRTGWTNTADPAGPGD